MSTPGPLKALACPNCSAQAQVPTYGSISFMGSRTWSDGFRDTLPDLGPTVVECARCHRCFYQADAPPAPTPPRDMPWISEPSEQAYYAALARGDFSSAPRVQRDVRLRAWWRRNDADRRAAVEAHAAPRGSGASEHVEPPASSADGSGGEGSRNMEILLTLLGDEPDQRFLKAELHRQLGRFAEAKSIFSGLTQPVGAIDRLIERCDTQDRRVMLVEATGMLDPGWRPMPRITSWPPSR